MLKNTGEAPPSNVHHAAGKPALPLVTWDHIISPEESERIVAALSAYPEVKSYRAGHSYRGRDISVMEITLPTPSEIVSTAKLTAYKPTILITGRQHANEVSSTSHILKLAELLATDPQYTAILKKVNVILHPVENPDGAAMVYELQKLTPNFMLHAGRYSALGMDVASQVGRPDPLLPEALVRGAAVGRVAAGHLPQPARLPVARVGPAVRRLRAARLPHLLVHAGLVHEHEPAAGSAPSGAGGSHRGDARGDRAGDQQPTRT